MAAGSLLALIDDIASILDDVAVLTKVATKKTAGVLGDDLALNAQQVSGVNADRELPVVWAVAKGSARNKLILVPFALAISAFIPWLVTPLLMVGGAFLCFEGFEKVAHLLFPSHEEPDAAAAAAKLAVLAENVDRVALERDKIRGAIRTDFILSAEIVAIALGTVADKPFYTQFGVLAGISALMTVGVYGLVAGIVKLDDLGLYLYQSGGDAGLRRSTGSFLLRASPFLMKGLSIAGTTAMFLVGGGILAHGIPGAEAFFEQLAEKSAGFPGIGALAHALVPTLMHAVTGIVAGGIVLLGVKSFRLLHRV